jgi:hypothetical protein
LTASITACRAFIVEGRIKPVHPQHAGETELVVIDELDVLGFLQNRNEIVRRLLDIIDLAVNERVHLRLIVRDVDPLDAIELGDLDPGHPARRLGARHVIGVLFLDDF